MVADGRPYQVVFKDTLIEVQVIDERGKLNINAVDEPTLVQLLTANGLELDEAVSLAAAILDWIDPDEIERANGAEAEAYYAAGLMVGPGNLQCMGAEELLQVLGMSFDLFRQIEPGLTVFSKSGMPNPAYAPLEALLALPDMDEEAALNFIEQRESQEASGGAGAVLPNGQVAMARGRGVTYSILAKATLPNGVWDQVESTIRLGGSSGGLPYRVVRWREGFHH